ADTNKAIQYVVRYTGRPAMAQSRILNYDGENVTFWYKRHEDDKKVIECISAFDFIKRLIIHIPESQFKTVRYYGLYAKKHKFSHLLFKMLPQSKRLFHERYSHWRERILLSFGYDPLKCTCGHIMELVDIFYPPHSSYNTS
ncbi:transposase, partial [Cellulosilyticum ruminicola]|uniref:transposase n=1 Tax=Cellulosilyticum ruminicola TaxID=425254 RepID=UPI00155DA23E